MYWRPHELAGPRARREFGGPLADVTKEGAAQREDGDAMVASLCDRQMVARCAYAHRLVQLAITITGPTYLEPDFIQLLRVEGEDTAVARVADVEGQIGAAATHS